MMNFGEGQKWYKQILAVIWHLPIQVIKEIRQERREKKNK